MFGLSRRPRGPISRSDVFDFAEDIRRLLDPSNPAYGKGKTSPHPAPEANDPNLLEAPLQFVSDLGRGVSEEGIAALLDPVGTVDRQDAKRDLAESVYGPRPRP